MVNVNELMLMNPDDIVGIMDAMNLITKETFDRFVTLLTHWYKRESLMEDNIPNLFPIFQMTDPIIDDLCEIFIESIGWRELGEQQMTHEFERNPEDKLIIKNQFVDGYDSVYSTNMVRDTERVFNSMNLVHRWDSTYVGGKDNLVTGGVVLEVW
jgi:hypothetical protein